MDLRVDGNDGLMDCGRDAKEMAHQWIEEMKMTYNRLKTRRK